MKSSHQVIINRIEAHRIPRRKPGRSNPSLNESKRKRKKGERNYPSSFCISADRSRTFTTPPTPYAGTILPMRANELEM